MQRFFWLVIQSFTMANSFGDTVKTIFSFEWIIPEVNENEFICANFNKKYELYFFEKKWKKLKMRTLVLILIGFG